MDKLDAIVDLSHYNGVVDFAAAKEAGIRAVIHKATQGTVHADRSYAGNRIKAGQAGLLWGAYHFGVGADAIAQAEHFLSIVHPATKLLVLDLEPNPEGPGMTLDEARAFVSHVREATGRWPGLYAGHYLKELLGKHTDPVLANCWFWLAQFGPISSVPPNWQNWTLWQYTDAGQVNGINPCDRSFFNGGDLKLLADMFI